MQPAAAYDLTTAEYWCLYMSKMDPDKSTKAPRMTKARMRELLAMDQARDEKRKREKQ